jgi:hypothetical protein
MTVPPEFPDFKPVELEDREIIQRILNRYQPQTSEWTFTNLLIWHSHYGFEWSVYRDWLLVLCTADANGLYALQPVGPPSRLEVVRMLLNFLQEEKKEREPRMERADQALVSEIQGATGLIIQPTRDHFDYVYKSEDLIGLAGRKYHSKRNHISKFERSHSATYAPLSGEHVKGCLELAEEWCEFRRCEEDMNLLDEWDAVREALKHSPDLRMQGGVILMENKVEAFALGELLNRQTAVVHIEKANPQIPELYAVINQQFCANSWRDVTYVNREQDLGEPGLRKAKLSYQPDHLVEKFRIRLA